MKMHEICIQNFFAIQEAEIKVDKILLLIGPQASGKSTVSKLVYFFKSLRQELLSTIYNYIIDNSGIELDTMKLRTSFWHEIRTKFYRYFGSTRHLPDFKIKYTYSNTKSIELALHPDKNLKLDFKDTLFSSIFQGELPTLIRRAMKERSTKNSVFDEIAFASSIKEIERLVYKIFEDDRTPVFVPASRSIAVSFPEQLKLIFFGSVRGDIRGLESIVTENTTTPASLSIDLYLISEFMKHTEGMKDRFRNNSFASLIDEKMELDKALEQESLNLALKKITNILRADYRLEGEYEKLYYDNNNYVDLNDSSSGQQESIRILQDIFLVILDKFNAFRVIEEPEAHLYPLAQKQLIELIALMLNVTDSQLIVTTHSPYVLSVFNNLLYAKRVVSLNPSAHDEIAETIPEKCWLQPESFHAYALDCGNARSIIDRELGLIDQNFLDQISEELGDEFNLLYRLRAEVAR